MSGIVHKESLPAQGHVKRRRVDVPPPAEAVTKNAADDESNAPDTANVNDGQGAEHATMPASSPGVAVASKAPHASSSSTSSDSDDDESDDEIERENARLAKLREQRSRRQEQSGGASAEKPGSGPASSSSTTATGTAPGSAASTNSYDHDVLFRNAAWRSSTKATTAEEKRKEKWNAVLNRTQDSVAHRHFMKNFFK